MPAPLSTYHAGVDENGLGPQLGPLLVTGVLAERQAGSARVHLDDFRYIHDSKRLLGHHNVSIGEAWARVLVPEATDPWDLLARVSIDTLAALRTPCPAGVERQCWSQHREGFQAPVKLLAEVAEEYAQLKAGGIHIRAVRSVVVCAKRLHEAQAQGHSLFATDLHCMERVCLALRAHAPTNVTFVCGKVGGMHSYAPRFRHLSPLGLRTQREGAADSTYHLPALGSLSFVRDADSSDLLVALASLVGKYLREWCMETIAWFYRERDPALPDPSGYRDPVTHRFILATAARRQTEHIPDTCFLRPQRASSVASPSSSKATS